MPSLTPRETANRDDFIKKHGHAPIADRQYRTDEPSRELTAADLVAVLRVCSEQPPMLRLSIADYMAINEFNP